MTTDAPARANTYIDERRLLVPEQIGHTIPIELPLFDYSTHHICNVLYYIVCLFPVSLKIWIVKRRYLTISEFHDGICCAWDVDQYTIQCHQTSCDKARNSSGFWVEYEHCGRDQIVRQFYSTETCCVVGTVVVVISEK